MTAEVPGIIMCTTLAASTGLVFSLAAGWFITKTADVDYVINGAIAGLVAITAPCHVVTGAGAAVIGAVGGLIMLCGTWLLEKLKIDDAVGAIPVHLFAGIWGTIAVALLGDPVKIGTGLTMLGQLGVQLTGIAATGLWAFGVSYAILFIINRISPLRVSEDAEKMGLNVAEHGATTEIFELYSVMDEQTRTGNLSLRVPEEPFTEVGQIARSYNTVMNSLESNLIAKSDYLDILDNVSDGLLLLDDNGMIGPFYSKVLEDILERTELSGLSFTSVFSEILPEKELREMEDFIGLVFNKSLALSTLNRLNPLNCVEVFIDDNSGGFKSKYLDVIFQRITADDEISRVMVIVRDLTEEMNLKHEMKRIQETTNTEMEMFYRILHIEPSMFIEFLASVEENLGRINGALEDDIDSLDSVLDTIYRHVHTIKGDANLFELDFIVEKAHNFEEKIELLKKKEGVKSSDFLTLAVLLSEMQESLNQMKTLIDRLLNFQKVFSSHSEGREELIVLSVKNLLERLCEKTGKIVELDYSGFDIRSVPGSLKRRIKEIVVQITQNSVIHGIEDPEGRRTMGKSESGIISISTSQSDGQLSLRISDDGRGIDFNLLKEKAIEKGMLKDNSHATKDQLMEYLFSPGFSTLDNADTHAGRGVGMDMIKRISCDIGATMTVKTRKNSFSEFLFQIPLHA